MATKSKYLTVVAAGAAIAIITAAPAAALSDEQLRYMTDVDEHGGISSSESYAPGGQTLGDAICGDLHKGAAAGNEVITVADEVMNGSMPKAEVSVYWAITDLCPDEIDQRKDHWRDGGH